MDSYIKFFQNFGIDINSAFSWGIENTIFPSMDIVEKAWRELLAKITNNQPVYIYVDTEETLMRHICILIFINIYLTMNV